MRGKKHFLLDYSHVANEKGTAIVSALLILMLLTFVALMATNTTTEEKLMVRSETIFEQVFDLAESANIEGIQLLADSDSDCSLAERANSTPTCPTNGILAQADEKDEENDIVNLDINNDNMISGSDFNNINRSRIDGTNATYKKLIQKKIEGSSLGLETSRLYSYNAYGFSEKYGSRTLIKMGYKKRFL
jgi:Tfp pilus assembly protein PilX